MFFKIGRSTANYKFGLFGPITTQFLLEHFSAILNYQIPREKFQPEPGFELWSSRSLAGALPIKLL